MIVARQRMIKPEFFSSESLGACSIPARLVFVGLLIESDDYGHLKEQILRLKKQILPYDRVKTAQFEHYLDELEQVGCIRRYEVDGCKYIDIPNFKAYQYVKKPSKSTIPDPPITDSTPLVPHYYPTSTPLVTLKKERKKEVVDTFKDVSTTKRKDAASGAAVGDPTPLPANQKVPSCPECGATLHADCKQGKGLRWWCDVHGFTESMVLA